jgi:phosphoribosylanthranilate isomerase
MAVKTKICGLKTNEAVDAAVTGGAAFVGFVFFPPSPRFIEFDQARLLSERIPGNIQKVALTVNETVDRIGEILSHAPIDILQLHGSESPGHVRALKERFSLPVMKAIPISSAEDLERAQQYEGVADYFLFDTKAPKDATRPGGNAVSFDWNLLTDFESPTPWMLAGGLTKDNVAEAVRVTGAKYVDLSSAVEDAVGIKNPDKITDFLFRTSKL